MLVCKEKEVAGFIKEVENSSLFQKLCYSERPEEKIINRKKFPQTRLNSGFYELNEEVIVSSGEPDINSFIMSRKDIISIIRRMGEDNFKKHFLYNETEKSLSEISLACNLTPREVKKIMEFINEFSIFSENFNYTSIDFEDEIRYTRIASIESGKTGDFSICFYSPHMARGKYIIDYQKLENLKRTRFFSVNELKNLEELIKQMKYINTRKTALYRVIQKIIECQRSYFNSGDWRDLHPLTQREVSRQIGVNPSTVSRIIAWRSIVAPWGEEKPIRDFFLGKTKEIKNLLKFIIDGNDAFSTDEEIKCQLKDKFGIDVSRRLVSKCRSELKIPPSTGKNGRRNKLSMNFQLRNTK